MNAKPRGSRKPLPFHGGKGWIRWGYHDAAAIERFTAIRRRDGQYDVTARITQLDAYRLKQHPLSFIAEVLLPATLKSPAMKVNYIWPVLEYALEAGKFKARLGSPVGPPQW